MDLISYNPTIYYNISTRATHTYSGCWKWINPCQGKPDQNSGFINNSNNGTIFHNGWPTGNSPVVHSFTGTNKDLIWSWTRFRFWRNRKKNHDKFKNNILIAALFPPWLSVPFNFIGLNFIFPHIIVAIRSQIEIRSRCNGATNN